VAIRESKPKQAASQEPAGLSEPPFQGDMTDFFEPGQKHVACARRALKGPGYAYKAG
jgi:hypothetical protein